MTEWFTAQELAELRLPGLPQSKRKINRLAAREAWHGAKSESGEPLCRRRDGRGGGFEFHVSLLPAVARTRLEARAGRARPEPDMPRDAGGAGSNVSRRDARLFVLARADEFARTHSDLTRRQADEGYASLYRSGVPDWVKHAVGRLSQPTLKRWRRLRDRGRFDLVAGRHGERRGGHAVSRLKDGEVATFIGALIVKQPFLTAPHIRMIVEGRFGEDLGELPDLRSFQRFVSAWKRDNRLAIKKLTDPDGFKSSARLTGSNANAHVTHLNQLWEIDASPADVLTTDGRHSIYALIDIWSRRMAVYVTKTPRTEATLLLIRHAILAWGVPQTIKTDNGSDFVSQRFVAAMNSLGIAHDTSEAFAPEQKGTVERAIGTLQRGLMRVLPGFVGHSVADRKVIEQRKAFAQRLGESEEQAFCVDISAAELQRYCDEWCANAYEHHPHAGLGGETPFQRAASYRGTVARVENERALDLLLAPVAGSDGWRQVSKQGIRLDAGWFISPELMPGQRVYCRQDPEDMGRLYCFESEAGRYLTTAVCPDRAGIDPKAAIKAARERQSELIAERTRDLKSAARKIKPRDMVDWLQKGARRRSATVTAFPHKATPHETAALAAAADATGAHDLPALDPQALPELAAANIVALPETPKQRFKRALRIEECASRGEPVKTEEALWLGSYRTTAEYKSHKAMVEDFGPDAVLETS
jgi:transposase InsO family protein